MSDCGAIEDISGAWSCTRVVSSEGRCMDVPGSREAGCICSNSCFYGNTQAHSGSYIYHHASKVGMRGATQPYLGCAAADTHMWAPTRAEGAAAALKAGTDLACQDYSYLRQVPRALTMVLKYCLGKCICTPSFLAYAASTSIGSACAAGTAWSRPWSRRKTSILLCAVCCTQGNYKCKLLCGSGA